MLAIQGDYAAHAAALEEAGAEPVLIRKPEELAGLNGLIIPGGESTTFLKFLERDGFLESLRTFAAATPTFGTCAGCILLAKKVLHPPQESLGVLDATVERNAYGRQIDSSIEETATRLGTKFDVGPLETVYIRAPRIQQRRQGRLRSCRARWLPCPRASGPSARRHFPPRAFHRPPRPSLFRRHGARSER